MYINIWFATDYKCWRCWHCSVQHFCPRSGWVAVLYPVSLCWLRCVCWHKYCWSTVKRSLPVGLCQSWTLFVCRQDAVVHWHPLSSSPFLGYLCCFPWSANHVGPQVHTYGYWLATLISLMSGNSEERHYLPSSLIWLWFTSPSKAKEGQGVAFFG